MIPTHSGPRTPDSTPWNSRQFGKPKGADGRTSYEIDRDRVVHSDSFRDLQYKTQVQGLNSSRTLNFRTRLNHVIEVAQIARSLARGVGGDEPLAEAIALAHDLGHPPFGHAGERSLRECLVDTGYSEWNANTHSLAVVDFLERSNPRYRGLNLTWAVREGIARHSTPFDEPLTVGEFATTLHSGLEAQVVDVADVLAYIAHDLDDALTGTYIQLKDARQLSSEVDDLVVGLEERWEEEDTQAWPVGEKEMVIRKALIAGLIGLLIKDVNGETRQRIAASGIDTPEGVRSYPGRLVVSSPPFQELIQKLLSFLTDKYYRSDRVVSDDRYGKQIVSGLFNAIINKRLAVPDYLEDLDLPQAAAYYVASFDDHAAVALAHKFGIMSDRRTAPAG